MSMTPLLVAQSNSSHLKLLLSPSRGSSATLLLLLVGGAQKKKIPHVIQDRDKDVFTSSSSNFKQLAIFIHRSFRSSGFNSDNFGDGDRLSFLGKQVLRVVVADVQFKRLPMLDFDELEVSTTAAPHPHLDANSPQSELENVLLDDTF